MRKNIHSEAMDQYFDAILSLKNRKECYAFFKDICTSGEMLSLSQRFDVGVRLLQGQTYQQISEVTGASTATISRVNRLLSDEDDGIEMAAGRIGIKAK